MTDKTEIKISDVTELEYAIAINDIQHIFIHIYKDQKEYYIKYFPKSKDSHFHIGISGKDKKVVIQKYIHLLKLIKKAQNNKKYKEDYIIVINNEPYLLSEIEFADDNDLIINV